MRDGRGRRHWAGEEGGGSAAGRHMLTDSRPHHIGGSVLMLPLGQSIHLYPLGPKDPSLVYSQPPHRTAVSGSSPNGPPPGSPSRPL